MKKQTQSTKAKDITHGWHLIDVKDKVLGRVSTDIAKLLMGKAKPHFVRNLDCGDHVIVINATAVKTTGKKDEGKKYYRYSGYPGGLRVTTLAELKATKPEEVVTHAVKGMLPQNRLRDKMLSRLHVYTGEEHPYTDKIGKKDK